MATEPGLILLIIIMRALTFLLLNTIVLLTITMLRNMITCMLLTIIVAFVLAYFTLLLTITVLPSLGIRIHNMVFLKTINPTNINIMLILSLLSRLCV